MASNGSLKLKSTSLLNMYNSINTYESTVQEALYSQYKSAYKLTVTNYMRGDAADAFKLYFSQGTVNMIQGILDISSEMTMIIQLITEAFYQFEGATNGVIIEAQLDDLNTTLDGNKRNYDEINSEIATVMGLAAQYISTVNIGFSDVDEAYKSVNNSIEQIRENMYSVDADALVAAEELLTRIQELKNQITQTMGLCYKDGNFIPSNASSLSKQNWYFKQSNKTLNLMLAEDPFTYDADAVSVSEAQWVSGLCSDVYEYGGYSFLSASYETGLESGTAFMKARASVLEFNSYAQLTDYIKHQRKVKFIYEDIDEKIGAGDGYFGAHVKKEAGVFKINDSAVIGADNFNGHINSDIQVLTVNGKAAFEFEEDGVYSVGIDAVATAASVSEDIGLSFLDYKIYDGAATGPKDSLFKLSAYACANYGGGLTIYSESKKAIETDLININATSITLKGSFIGGVGIQVTVPDPHFKWPW